MVLNTLKAATLKKPYERIDIEDEKYSQSRLNSLGPAKSVCYNQNDYICGM